MNQENQFYNNQGNMGGNVNSNGIPSTPIMQSQNTNIVGNASGIPSTPIIESANPNMTSIEPMNQQMAMMGGTLTPEVSAYSEVSKAPMVENSIENQSSSISVANDVVPEPYVSQIEEVDNTEYMMSENIDLERRNKAGIRFIIIFGLLILIFIILLPFINTLF